MVAKNSSVVRVPDDVLAAIDARRGTASRGDFLRELLADGWKHGEPVIDPRPSVRERTRPRRRSGAAVKRDLREVEPIFRDPKAKRL